MSYKIIARILVKRLRNYLKYHISPFQAAFIRGRWIVEPLITQETAMIISKKTIGKGGLMTIKEKLIIWLNGISY